ncbi:MAG: FlgD immunoglobulin-like domain containing protein, partial [bacterium]
LHYAEYRRIDAVFAPGTAFWLITRDGLAFDVEIAQSVDATVPYQITLQPGWNQIANPFAFPVAWQDISADGLVQPPVYYDGTEVILNVPVLLSWEGYFVFNLGLSPVTLSIPPVEASDGEIAKLAFSENRRSGSKASPDASGHSHAKHGNEKNHSPLEGGQGGVTAYDSPTKFSQISEPENVEEYTLQIAARIPNSDFRDTQNFLGFKPNSQDGWDNTDFYEAPAINDALTLSILENGDRYAANFRAMTDNGASWDIEIGSNMPETEISVVLNEFGSLNDDFMLYVLDQDRGAAIPVQNNAFMIIIDKSVGPRHLKIILGAENFAEEASDGIPLTPLAFVLEQNYPNPFNPSTAISYRLSAISEVDLTIYDQLGRIVRTLVHEQQPAGNYAVTWDGRTERGRQAASGVYLYRLRAGEFVQTRKMLLMR